MSEGMDSLLTVREPDADAPHDHAETWTTRIRLVPSSSAKDATRSGGQREAPRSRQVPPVAGESSRQGPASQAGRVLE